MPCSLPRTGPTFSTSAVRARGRIPKPVTADEELRRVLPVIEQLAQHRSIPISIDTSKAVVAARPLRAGAEIINDVTGLEGDPEMVPLAA